MERALVTHYGHKRKRMWIAFALSLALLIFPTCWVLVTKPEDGFFNPVTTLALVGVVGVVASLYWLASAGNYLLLRTLRENPRSMRAVRRGDTVFQGRTSGVEFHRTPTLFVDLVDGRTLPLHIGSDGELFARLEKLLNKHIEENRTGA
ncbi:MAG TPA: hypothetical protein VFF06_33500 [Polyangia bacterium]|nr:hypothetical protein [Polyangia bacterium]